jgi:hypothetical protein
MSRKDGIMMMYVNFSVSTITSNDIWGYAQFTTQICEPSSSEYYHSRMYKMPDIQDHI